MTSDTSLPTTRLLALLLLCLVMASCLNNANTDCIPDGDCLTVRPTTASLSVRINTNAENPAVPIAIYYGDASDSALFFRDTITASTSYAVALDTRYSGVAKYRQGNLTILAIDGDKTKLTSDNECGFVCYSVKDASMQLKLAK